MKPADIHLLALDYEPVWLRKFCGQRHGFHANDNTEHRPLAPYLSGHSAAAAKAIHRKDQAAGGGTGCIMALRMDGNAEPINDRGCGFPNGNRLAPPVVLNLHSTLPSDEGERNHGV